MNIIIVLLSPPSLVVESSSIPTYIYFNSRSHRSTTTTRGHERTAKSFSGIILHILHRRTRRTRTGNMCYLQMTMHDYYVYGRHLFNLLCEINDHHTKTPRHESICTGFPLSLILYESIEVVAGGGIVGLYKMCKGDQNSNPNWNTAVRRRRWCEYIRGFERFGQERRSIIICIKGVIHRPSKEITFIAA